jgi:hypothetical protein
MAIKRPTEFPKLLTSNVMGALSHKVTNNVNTFFLIIFYCQKPPQKGLPRTIATSPAFTMQATTAPESGLDFLLHRHPASRRSDLLLQYNKGEDAAQDPQDPARAFPKPNYSRGLPTGLAGLVHGTTLATVQLVPL